MSDLLIRGMEMPKGGYRTVEIAFDADGHPMALADGGDVFDVIPVPPHGRLGDLDKLADNMRSATAGMEHRAIIMHEIRRAPTVIPAEIISENEIKIIDTKGKSNYDPKRRFVIPAEEEST